MFLLLAERNFGCVFKRPVSAVTQFIYRVIQKSEATTFEGSDLCMPTIKMPNVYDKFYEYGVNRCIQNITALK